MKRLVLAAPVAAVLLAGCSHPFHAGAAATVGSDRISTSQLRTMVDRGLAGVPAGGSNAPTAESVERQDLGQLIQLQILHKMVSDLHAPAVTDQQIDATLTTQQAQFRQQVQQQQQQGSSQITDPDLTHYVKTLGIDEKTLRTYIEVTAYRTAVLDALPTDAAILAAAYQKNLATYQQVHVAHILVKTKAEATSLLADIRAFPGSFAQLAKEHSIDTGSAAKGGDLGFAPRGAYVAPFATAAFAGKDGTVVGPVKTQFGYHLIKIIEHRTTTLQQATPMLKEQLNGQEFVTRYLATAKALHISVNPRFGQWQVSQQGITQSGDFGSVVASTNGDLSVPVTPSPTANPLPGQR